MAGAYKVSNKPLTENDLRSIETNLENGDLTVTQAYNATRKLLKEVKEVRRILKENKPPPKTRCTHINRLALEGIPNVKIGNGVSVGQCESYALPYFVVCVNHMDKEGMAYLISKLADEITRVVG